MLYLQPNRHFAKPDVFDRSGLWVVRANDGSAVEIADVIPDRPVSKVGLKVGERILKVDRTDASVLTVAALREQLEKEPGTKIDLEVQDDEGVHEVVLALEELL
jgi:C-terminal processing protease CtpA/Prc